MQSANSGATVWFTNERQDAALISTHDTAACEVIRGNAVIYKEPPDIPDVKQ
jgi:hypothetical protein